MKSQRGRTCIFMTLALAISAAARAQSAGDLGLSGGGQTWRNLSGTSNVMGMREILPSLARTLASSGVQAEAKAGPGGEQATAAASQKSAGSLEGTVKDDSGRTVPGVVVSVKDSAGNSRTVITDAGGGFRIATFSAEKGKLSLEGTVTGSSGDAVLGVMVTVKTPQGDSKTVVTDPAGKFQITGLRWANEPNILREHPRANRPGGTGSQITFWSLQGLMFGTAIAAIETTHNCITSGSCTAIPLQFQSRSAMYAAGLPVVAGIAIISYEMKKHGNRWWYVPPAIVTGLVGVLTVHSARASD